MSYIVLDVGGTNVRFALTSATGVAGTTLSDISMMKCVDFGSIDDAIAAYLSRLNAVTIAKIEAVAIAVAAAVNTDIVDVTNNHWVFEKHQLFDRLSAGEVQFHKLKIDRLLVINDFTAQALAQSNPHGTGNVQLLEGVSDDHAPLLVIGPGTGLGVSALIPSAGGLIPLEGEGGHVSFSPRSDGERDLDAFMRQRNSHLTAEHFVCGAGLENIHAFLRITTKRELDSGPDHLTAPEIGEKALAEDGMCRDAVRMMFGIFGTVIADNVLSMGCWRGVVIAGGIVPKLAPLIADSPFTDRFRNTGLTTDLLSAVPVWLCVDPYAGLSGGAIALENKHLRPRSLTR